MATYGLTPAGFVGKSQAVIKAELEATLQQAFGLNINLAPNSNFGQLVGIISEREALIWQLAEAVYASQNPGGAEGTSVDNILALNNLRRLQATATRTNPTALLQPNGITLYGIVLRGTPGTVIPAGSLIETQASPPVQFSLNAPVTILAAVNALQSLFMSNAPTMGAFQLSLVDSFGETLTSPSFAWNALAQVANFKFASVPVSGQFTLALAAVGATLNTPTLNFNATAPQIQTAIRTLGGYGAVNVTGSMAAGFLIDWGNIPHPNVAFNTNTTGVLATFLQSIQAGINNLFDAVNVKYPFTDVQVTPGASGFNFLFGAFTQAAGQTASGAQPQPLFLLVSNTLMQGASVTNLNIVNTNVGAKAQGVGSATCTQTGPNFVSAGTLNVISSPLSGWTSVNNELDCITGTAVEDDTEALVRRENNLQANANGPLQAIIEKVRAVTDVITAIGFENLNEAALQVITFPIVPSSGKYNLILNGHTTPDIQWDDDSAAVQTAIRSIAGYELVLVTGSTSAGFTIDFNGVFGGQPQPLILVTGNTTGGSIDVAFGRPGKSFEIVVEGGADLDIAEVILNSKPAGIQSYGSTTVQVFDQYDNPYNISFSRPTSVPIYATIVLQTDLSSVHPKFNPQSIQTIQQDIVDIINGVGIGGLVIGFGSDGLIGAFNSVPGIIAYTLFFDRAPNPLTNTNLQMQPEEVPLGETFNVAVSYT